MRFKLPVVAKLLIASLITAAVCSTQVAVTTIADIAGDGAVHAIAGSGTARWIQFVTCGSTSTGCVANTKTVRVGDANISTTQGTPLLPGAGQMWPPLACEPGDRTHCLYNLANSYYVIQSGDHLSITLGQ